MYYESESLNELHNRIKELQQRLRDVNRKLKTLEKGSYRGGEVILSFSDYPFSEHKLLWNTTGFKKLFGKRVSDAHIEFYETGKEIPVNKMTVDEDAEPILNALKKYLERTKSRLEKDLNESREELKTRVEEL